MAKRRSTISEQGERSDTTIVNTNKVLKRFGPNRSLVKFLYVRQEDADMPASGSSFSPTKLLFRRMKIIGVHSHASAGTWSADVTIAGSNVGQTFTNSNSGDAEEPLQFTGEIIYENNDLITVKMASGDSSVEDWEAIIIMLALDQA